MAAVGVMPEFPFDELYLVRRQGWFGSWRCMGLYADVESATKAADEQRMMLRRAVVLRTECDWREVDA